MTTDVTPDERRDAYGFSGQSSVQKIHSPVMHNTGVNSIQLKKFHHIETQTKYRIQQARHRSEQNTNLRKGCRGQLKSCNEIRGHICF